MPKSRNRGKNGKQLRIQTIVSYKDVKVPAAYNKAGQLIRGEFIKKVPIYKTIKHFNYYSRF